MEVSDAVLEKDRSWVTLSLSMISLRLWDITRFVILGACLGRIGMQQPFSNTFASLMAVIIARLPDADLWLPFKSRWLNSVMRVLSSMGVV